MPTPPSNLPADPPPSPSHLRPPLPPELRPTPASLAPSSPATLSSTHPATSNPLNLLIPATLPPLLVVEDVVVGGSDSEDESDPNYGHGIIANGANFGKPTYDELLQANLHLEASKQELFKSHLEWKRRMDVRVEEDVASLVASSEDEEESGLDQGLDKEKDEAFRVQMNAYLASKRIEDGKRAGKSIAHDCERNLEKLQGASLESIGVAGIPITAAPPASFPVESLGPNASLTKMVRGGPRSHVDTTLGIQETKEDKYPHLEKQNLDKNVSHLSSSHMGIPMESVGNMCSSHMGISLKSTINPLTSLSNSTTPQTGYLLDQSIVQPLYPLSYPSSQPPQLSKNNANLRPSTSKPTSLNSTHNQSAITHNQNHPNSKTSPLKPILSGHNQKTPQSWSSLLTQPQPRLNLKFVKPLVNEKGSLTLEKGLSKEGEDLWKSTLIGYFIDRKIPFKLLQHRVMVLWGKLGLKEVRTNKEGFIFFTFHSEEGRSEVLEKGPWIILGQQLYLKAWTRSFDFRKEEFKSIPNWVKFFGVPTTYWSASGLSTIASKIGTPLYADEITSSARILDFARICVEMKVGSEFPLNFMVQTEFGEEFEVRVEYSWRPRQCFHCNVFGHQPLSCPKIANKRGQPLQDKTYTIKPNHTKPTLNPIPTTPPLVINPIPTAKTILKPTETSNPAKTSTEPKTTTLNPHNHPKQIHTQTTPLPMDNPTILATNTITKPLLILPNTTSPLTQLKNKFSSLDSPSMECNATVETMGVSCGMENVDGKKAENVSQGRVETKGEDSISPNRWGHKVRLIDELERKKHRNARRSEQRKKKKVKEGEEGASNGVSSTPDQSRKGNPAGLTLSPPSL